MVQALPDATEAQPFVTAKARGFAPASRVVTRSGAEPKLDTGMLATLGRALVMLPKVSGLTVIDDIAVFGSFLPVSTEREALARNPAGPVIRNLLNPVGEPTKVLAPTLLPMKPTPPRVPCRNDVMRGAAIRQSIFPDASALQELTVPHGSLMV